MSRIIAGTARGFLLSVPQSGTRPTSDRIREALFSALDAHDFLDGARVLDLYAGSGALGLEAFSRGAAQVDLVEKSGNAARVIRKNITTVQKATASDSAVAVVPIRLHEKSVQGFLRSAQNLWDLVFIDPPYELTNEQIIDDLAALLPHLAPEALVVLERGRKTTPPPFTSAGYRLDQTRPYGDTALYWLEPDN